MNWNRLLVTTLQALIVTTSAAALAGAGGAPSDLRAGLHEYIEREMRENRIVGLSAAVIAGGRTVVLEGFGTADRETGVPVTARTLFPIGSTTKLFTATAVMQLVEKGLVDLDAPIETYLPDFSIRRRNGQEGAITVRQLLTHHSGLPGNLYADFQPDEPRPDEFRRLPELVGSQTLADRPGTVFAYSNLGYALLGCVIESVSGLPYTAYVQANVLNPLRMTQTLMLPPENPTAESNPQVTRGYRGRRAVDVYAIRDLPAGAMLSSGVDMTAFMRMVLSAGAAPSGRILKRGTFEQMVRRQNAGVDLDQDFAIGLGYWLIDPIGLPGERLASHGGDLPPFHSVLVTLPDAGIAVFLAGNSATTRGTVITMASEIVRRVYEAETGVACPPMEPADRVALEPEFASSLPGLYASPVGLLEVTIRGGRLRLGIEGLPLKLELVPRADGTFTPELRLLRLIRLRPEGLDGLVFRPFRVDGTQCLQIAAAGVAAGAAMRFDPAPPQPQWLDRTGRYRITKGGSNGVRENLQSVRVDYDRRRGVMLLRCRLVGQRMSLPLGILGDNRAVILGHGNGLGDTLEWLDTPSGEALHWSGLTLERE